MQHTVTYCFSFLDHAYAAITHNNNLLRFRRLNFDAGVLKTPRSTAIKSQADVRATCLKPIVLRNRSGNHLNIASNPTEIEISYGIRNTGIPVVQTLVSAHLVARSNKQTQN